MSITNAVKLVGTVGRDAEIVNRSGTDFANFSVACKGGHKDKSGGWVDTVEWVNCVAIGKTAVTIGKLFKKGSAVIIAGALRTTSWDDKNGGSKRYKTEVVVEQWTFQQGRPQASQGGSSNPNGAGPASNFNDEIRF